MPYETKADGENVDVINSETGEVRATHTPPDAKEKADRQVKLLNEIEKDPRWEEDNATD